MIDLKDVTFTIPIRIDTLERSRNLRTSVAYLNKHFDTNILVCEESSISQVPSILNGLKYNYSHIQTNDPLMRRTKILNIMAKAANTPIVVNYDADVFFKISQYIAAAEKIRSGAVDMVYPYNGRFIDLVEPFISRIVNNLDVEGIHEHNGQCIHPSSLGGAVMWNKSKFIEIGMENENCISWGFEDNERLARAMKTGCRVSRTEGCLFHLHHPASANSANPDNPAYKNNQIEFNKVNNMNSQQLRDYIKTWSWCKV